MKRREPLPGARKAPPFRTPAASGGGRKTPAKPPVLNQPAFIHGSLVKFQGRGLLITGESGVGKSRCCLDLMRDGALLVADDLVEISPAGGGLIGRCPAEIKGLIEIRGRGITSAVSLFGAGTVIDSARIDLVIEIAPEGAGRGSYRVLGREIPLEKVPENSGGRVSEIVKQILERECPEN